MNKTSISRILSILAVTSIPCNIIVIFGIMIGGGFGSIDTRGFIFWGIVLIFFAQRSLHYHLMEKDQTSKCK